jgi:hypothetical protein
MNTEQMQTQPQISEHPEVGPPGPAPPAEHQKQIILLDTPRRVASAKPKVRRIPTQKWGEVSNNDLSIDHQHAVLSEISENPNTKTKWGKHALQHIHTKINSYKYQDILKTKYSEHAFVDLPYVLQRLLDSGLACFYCKGQVKILYEYVRETSQWTLERIDNSVGHNRGNVEIACLKCNLSRRCMFHERYKQTKEMTKVVKLGGDGDALEGHTGVL